MKNCAASLLLLSVVVAACVAAIPFTSAKTTTKYAVVEVRCDSGTSGTLYLARWRGTLLEYVKVDSARMNDAHSYRIAIEPDPSLDYRLMLGDKLIAYDVYLAPGDSLVYHYDPMTGSGIQFDRIGANIAEKQFHMPWGQLNKNLASMDWEPWQIYLASLRDSTRLLAQRYHAEYPKHAAIYRFFQSLSQSIYDYGRLNYLYSNYWDSTGRPVINAPERLRILDSIPWTEDPLAQSDELYGMAAMWINVEWQKWRYDGVDTAGKTIPDVCFSFVHKLPAHARDVAEMIALNQSIYSASPSALAPKLQHELRIYKKLSRDTGYVALFERQLASVQSRLPGKPIPRFSLPDTSGRERSTSEFRGKIVYLDFWGTWCPPCLEELPSFDSLERQFVGDTNVEFVSIALESPSVKSQTIEAWRKFIAKHPLLGIQLYAEPQTLSPVAQAYGVQGLPTFMLIGRDGTFIDADAPRPGSRKAEAEIRAALAGKSE